jgi:hypothetical protein
MKPVTQAARSHLKWWRRVMLEKTQEQVWAAWLSKQNGGNFQEMLNAQTEDGKYQILAKLLSDEVEQIKKAPRFSSALQHEKR